MKPLYRGESMNKEQDTTQQTLDKKVLKVVGAFIDYFEAVNGQEEEKET